MSATLQHVSHADTLHETGHVRIKAALVLAQQRQSLLCLACPLQNDASNDLDCQVLLAMLLSQLLRRTSDISALLEVCQKLHGLEVWGLFAGEFGGNGLCLSKGDLRTCLQDADGQRIARGEGGGVEVKDLLVCAGVERCVDVDKLWRQLAGCYGHIAMPRLASFWRVGIHCEICERQ